MYRSGIILAGGSSNRFGQEKSSVNLLGKPLIKHVIDGVSGVVDEVLVVVSSQVQAEKMRKMTAPCISVLVDDRDLQGPLAGALTGFDKAGGQYSLLLP